VFLNKIGKAPGAGPDKGQVSVFQNKANHKGGYNHIKAVNPLTAERAVCDAFNGDAQKGSRPHGENQRYDKHRDSPAGHEAQQRRGDKKGEIRTRHKNIAVGKVDKPQNAIDQAVAQRDYRIETPPLKGIKNIL
jgi:hypothetical protein